MTNTATQTRPQSRSAETARRTRRSTSRAAAERSEAAATEQPATTRPAGRRTAGTRTTTGRTAAQEATTAAKAAAKTAPAAPGEAGPAGPAEPSPAERAAERAAGKAVAGAESALAQAKWTARTLASAVPLPEPRRLLYYGGIGALAALGILEWPVAAVAAVGVWVATHTDGHEQASHRAAGPPGADMEGVRGVPATAR
ncbi:hypothetical protein Drose_18460 [Dactylosporangium roseum]|uniref:Uncharacterized protein n=1 Tax=Dactylosporangium roseum TaxID=47989 RepID=A0ABY5ZEA4_9ACTN|nr:hypothetical protein [Dactylosporangium roseum]UWZ40009.1 hypothetical protein Drose_18460 [Dactylosporangium roseum]